MNLIAGIAKSVGGTLTEVPQTGAEPVRWACRVAQTSAASLSAVLVVVALLSLAVRVDAQEVVPGQADLSAETRLSQDPAPQVPSPAPKPETQPKKKPTTQAKPTTPGKPTTPPSKEASTARQLLDDAVKAYGGMEKLGALKSLRWEAVESRLQSNGSIFERTIVGRVRFPDHMRIEISFRDPSTQVDRKLIFTLDGHTGWLLNGAALSDLAATDVANQRASLLCSTTPLLQAADQLMVMEKDRAILGATEYRVLEVKRGALAPVTLWIDPDNHTIRRRESITMRNGSPVKREEQLWDYRNVDGLVLPHSRKVFENGQEIALFSLNKYVANEEYGAELFTKPKQ